MDENELRANDMLAAVVQQREQAMNANVEAHAHIVKQHREIEALRSKFAELEKKLAKLQEPRDRPTPVPEKD